MLSLCVKNNFENREYFRNEMQGFGTLEETLSKGGFMEEEASCMRLSSF